MSLASFQGKIANSPRAGFLELAIVPGCTTFETGSISGKILASVFANWSLRASS
jgi:hypothetical protein